MKLYYVPLILAPLLLLNTKSSSSPSSESTGDEFPFVKKVANVPFAKPASSEWPVITKHPRGQEVPYLGTNGKYVGNASRAFGSSRADGKRKHVGIDLYCYANDVVVATESGKIVGIQGFLGPTKAILLQGNSGIVTLYGEVKNGSWTEFGIFEGANVKAGDPIARIGVNAAGTYMLHFETYNKDVTQNTPWYSNSPPPANILNPTKYLLKVQKK